VTTTRGVLLDTVVNPGESIPPDATAIHGITDADVVSAQFDLDRLGREVDVSCGEAAENLEKVAKERLSGIGAVAEDAMVPL
jgi:DNA polymerase III epsilon subunit-like protein